MSAEFISKSRASFEALRSANLLKSLNINALIIGEEGVGKTTLAKYIIDAPVVDAQEGIETIVKSLQEGSDLIIKNFDKILHFDILEKELKQHKNRIIATSRKDIYEKISDKFFSLKINLPPLRERSEDISLLSKKFFNEIVSLFSIGDSLELDDIHLDISRNCHSLKESVYKAVVESVLDEDDIMRILENILSTKIGSKDDYRKNLYLYEIPLIKAGKKRFKSQSKMAEEFGINRNTLRKKINEYNLKI